jgi:N-methylhydantoinase B
VLRDVRNEFLSAARAKADYGVIVETRGWRVDDAATQKLRAEMRAARGWREVPKVQWHEPATLTQAAE